MLRQPVDLCLFPKRILDCRDQVLELNGFTFAEIKDVEVRAVVVQRGNRPLNHVVDVCVIASRCAIAELINRLAGVNASSELMDRQIRPLPRTVNSEIPQRDHTHLIKMRVSRAEEFARNFRSGVRANRLSEMLIL